jgi:hypothetical protein
VTKKINGLTEAQFQQFQDEMRAAPCTREAIDALHVKYFGSAGSTHYPDEYYADKDNRMAGNDTGHLRFEGGKMVWVKHDQPQHPA